MRMQESEFLFINGYFDAAYYMGGYVFEYLLKARICKTLGIEDLLILVARQKEKLKMRATC